VIKIIQKYGAYIFLLNNLLFSISGFHQIATSIFLVLSVFFLVITLLNAPFFKNVILHKSFRFYLSIHAINLLYYLLIEFGDIESFKYLSAKFIQLIIFTSTIYFTHKTFKIDLIRLIKYLCVLSLILSIIFNFPGFTSRYLGIFFNPNEFAIIMVYGFSLFLITTKKSLINIVFLILFLIFILLSGSRAALLGIVLSILVNFKLKRITVFSTLLIFLVAYLFRELPAISRLLNEDILFNRQYEIIYAFETFYNELWFGNGLKNYAYINENVISSYDQEIDFGAHNGYLSLLVQYGLVFSIIFYTIVTKNLYKISVYLRSKMREDTGYKYFYFIIIYTLTNGMFENSFSGINFFQGSLFWLVIGYVLYDINLQKSTDEDSILPN
tara:strand:+ start:7474 stop:8625 length:1152 start_codon:yes stop_codon:yes gene_type:complete